MARVGPSSKIIAFAAIVALGERNLPAQTTTPGTPPNSGEISRLINLLGDSDFAQRQLATQQLTQMGDAALPDLREAMKSPDAEISNRAQLIYRAITDLPPDRRDVIATTAAKAFANADYDTAARQQTLLARRLRPTIAECLAAGQDWQLAGKYAAAVAAYQRTSDRMEEVLDGDSQSDAPPPPPQGIQNGLNANGIHGVAGLTDTQRRNLLRDRAGLILLIGRLQREELADPAAAAQTFSGVLAWVPEFKGDLAPLIAGLAVDIPARRAADKTRQPGVQWDPITRYLQLINECEIMQELARTQERLAKNDAALLTLARLANMQVHLTGEGVDDSLSQMIRLLSSSPNLRQLPGAATLMTLLPPQSPLPEKPPQAQLLPDSPFQWTPTNLGNFNLGPLAIHDLRRRRDGRWIAALTAGPRIFIATTHDLITWDAPLPLPLNSIANNTDPALILDDQGTLWLTWFANPLSLQPRGSAGYSLWLSHSTDAKNWSPPRIISAKTGGWPMGSMHWLRTPDGQFRLSWRIAAATASSPAQITALEPIAITPTERMWPMEPNITCDDAGRFHLVFTDLYSEHNHGLTYSTSDDGKKWSDPLILIENQPAREPPHHPQLLMNGQQLALLYQESGNQNTGGGYFRTGTLAALPALSAPIQINRRSISTAETPWIQTGDQIVGLTSGEKPFLLTAKSSALFKDP